MYQTLNWHIIHERPWRAVKKAVGMVFVNLRMMTLFLKNLKYEYKILVILDIIYSKKIFSLDGTLRQKDISDYTSEKLKTYLSNFLILWELSVRVKLFEFFV